MRYLKTYRNVQQAVLLALAALLYLAAVAHDLSKKPDYQRQRASSIVRLLEAHWRP
ncbi:MAG: hypothetical protein HC842_09170 [Cytophagales bacterium]|nr:hypothetical protein [Cytophagales bacterium]